MATSHPARGAWIEISFLVTTTPSPVSHPARGAWIEIAIIRHTIRCTSCRTPHGVRGLKLIAARSIFGGCWSHPARGAWIEIGKMQFYRSRSSSRTPHGVRGLKSLSSATPFAAHRRTPHGVRGLKCASGRPVLPIPAVAPRAERPQRQTPRTANAVRGVHIKGRHALPKERDRKRADTVAQREKRYHERSKRDLWACTLPNEGVCSA